MNSSKSVEELNAMVLQCKHEICEGDWQQSSANDLAFYNVQPIEQKPICLATEWYQYPDTYLSSQKMDLSVESHEV